MEQLKTDLRGLGRKEEKKKKRKKEVKVKKDFNGPFRSQRRVNTTLLSTRSEGSELLEV